MRGLFLAGFYDDAYNDSYNDPDSSALKQQRYVTTLLFCGLKVAVDHHFNTHIRPFHCFLL